MGMLFGTGLLLVLLSWLAYAIWDTVIAIRDLDPDDYRDGL